MLKIFKKVFDHEYKELEKFKIISNKVLDLDEKFSKLSDKQLKNKTIEFKERLEKSETLDDILVEAFATAREASFRYIGQKPFFSQVLGGVAVHFGNIAELKTGEGKTLTTVLPAYLNALSGNGVHVITVNEYLTSRNAEWMGTIFDGLGITVGVNIRSLSLEEKREAYKKDIIYTTNSEIGFDYLRDNMVSKKEERVQRKLNFAILDEVDSILIDEARTPLIISGGKNNNKGLYKEIDSIVKKLKDEDYTIDEKYRNITLTEDGVTTVEKLLKIDNLYGINNTHLVHFVNQSLKANYIMKNEIDYLVSEDAIVIIDAFTGRLMKGRAYSDGLHQAIEAKEGVKINEETNTMATITYQNLFRMYKKLSGMTGTAKTEEEEFRDIYNMYVLRIPTNVPIARCDYEDILFADIEGKYSSLVKFVKEKHEKGQPILIGTVAVETSELISDRLKKVGVKHEVLNAKNHAREAEIIEKAGEKNSVTIATNMAGRGTDIKLGKDVAELGGLCVIGTERHESRRIDDQLRGRSGRQGDPGMSQFFVSFQDELMLRFGADRIKNILNSVGMKGEVSLQNKMFTRSFETAQKRIEGHNFDTRKHLLKYDNVLNEQREIIYSKRNEILDSESIRKTIYILIDEYIMKFCASHIMPEGEFTTEDLQKITNYVNEKLLKEDITCDILKDKSLEELTNLISSKIKDEYEEKIEEQPKEVVNNLEKVIYLKNIDIMWQEHMNTMVSLKDGIGLRSYAQENPLQAYIMEGYSLFNNMLLSIYEHTATALINLKVNTDIVIKEEKKEMITNDKEASAKRTIVKDKKIGRNDPCTCGSGKKYKQCCGK
ncbi:MAG: preprotein translocase subunit SecA [Bacilli bacterium]